MGKVYVGTCSWTDKSLVGSFYPEDTEPSEMLDYYSRFFPAVEVDSTFYRMPNEYMASAWAKRTPPGFKFHIKAFGPMTTHAGEYEGEKVKRATEEMIQEFEDSLTPLGEAGKLGYILFQFPKWFFPSPENKDYIAWCAEHLQNSLIAVEFRNGYWFKNEERTSEILDFLAGHGIVYTCVDEPQIDIKSNAPLLDAVTDPEMAVMRLHGRKAETWNMRGVSVEERFDYDYTKDELSQEIAPRVLDLSKKANETHVMFNNVHHAYGPSDARDLIDILQGLGVPVVTPQEVGKAA
jgi:uncharacterized protein YecE (DUF72 family)